MTQTYFDPEREEDEYALPDCEVFYVSADEFISSDEDSVWHEMYEDELDKQIRTDSEDPEQTAAQNLSGWYYWACFPGCLPDSDPIGPFDTEEEAIAAAQSE